MQEFIRYVILGIPVGCVFGLVAVGLVLTYKTSGVFNLAFAAQAYLAAAVYYDVHVRHEWPIIPAFVLAVFVVSPLVGLILDRFVFRWLRGASPIGKLVSSLGLLVALPQIVERLARAGPDRSASTASGGTTTRCTTSATTTLDGRQMAILVSTVVVVLLLVALFRWTAIGLQMRAVVESPRLTELAGVNADRASSAAWMLSSTMAGLAGVLLAPFSSIAQRRRLHDAARLRDRGRRVRAADEHPDGAARRHPARRSRSALLAGYLPPASLLAQGLKPALPFAALFLLLLFWPGLRNRRGGHGPAVGRGPAAAVARVGDPQRAVHPLHPHPRRRCSSVVVVLHRARRGPTTFWLSLLTLALVVLGDLPVDHGDHRHGRPDLAVPGDVRGHRRVHDRAVRRARSAPTCCSG